MWRFCDQSPHDTAISSTMSLYYPAAAWFPLSQPHIRQTLHILWEFLVFKRVLVRAQNSFSTILTDPNFKVGCTTNLPTRRYSPSVLRWSHLVPREILINFKPMRIAPRPVRKVNQRWQQVSRYRINHRSRRNVCQICPCWDTEYRHDRSSEFSLFSSVGHYTRAKAAYLLPLPRTDKRKLRLSQPLTLRQ
jgi:hypothetical protein